MTMPEPKQSQLAELAEEIAKKTLEMMKPLIESLKPASLSDAETAELARLKEENARMTSDEHEQGIVNAYLNQYGMTEENYRLLGQRLGYVLSYANAEETPMEKLDKMPIEELKEDKVGTAEATPTAKPRGVFIKIGGKLYPVAEE